MSIDASSVDNGWTPPHWAVFAFETLGFAASLVAMRLHPPRLPPRPRVRLPMLLLWARAAAWASLSAALFRHLTLVGPLALRKYTVWNALLQWVYYASCLGGQAHELIDRMEPAGAGEAIALTSRDSRTWNDGSTAAGFSGGGEPLPVWTAPQLQGPLLAVVLPNAMVISGVTWLVLYPRLPDEQQLHLLSPHSLVEHGGSCLLLIAEASLLRAELAPHPEAALTLVFAFGLWHEVWHAATAETIYPFMSYDDPGAPLRSAALALTHLVTHLVICRASRCGTRCGSNVATAGEAAARREPRPGEPATELRSRPGGASRVWS